MKKQNSYFVEEREIEGKKMFAQILKRWRLVLLLAVIGAVLAVAADYRMMKKSAAEEAQAAADKANAAPVTIESLEKGMDRFDRQQVWRFVYMTNTLEERKNYLNESIRMTINPYKERVIDMEYQVVAESTTAAETAAQNYAEYIAGEQFAKALVKQLGLDMHSCYIQELVSTEASGDTVKIRLIAGSREVCNYLADAAETVIADYTPETENVVTITQENRTGMFVIDKELAEEQEAFNDDLELYTSSYNSLKKSLDDKQSTLANMLLKAGIKSENAKVLETEALEAAVEESTEETAETEETEEADDVEVQPAAVSIRFGKAPLGVIAGILVAIVWVMLCYALSQGIHGMEEAKYLFGVRDMGTVSALSLRKKRLGSPVDFWMEKLGCGRHNYVEYDKQLALICANLLLTCKKENITEVAVAGSRLSASGQKIVEQMKVYLAKEGITLKSVGNVLCDGCALLTLAQTGTVLLVEEDERSCCNDIAKELNVFKENELQFIGMVLISNC